MRIAFIILALIILMTVSSASDSFFDDGKVQKIELFFSFENWDYRLDTAKLGYETYIPADSIIINGYLLDSVGVRYKGNSSYDSTFRKNPFNISLDEYKNHNYQGIKTIKLANFYQDPAMIREILAYRIAADYMDCPRANFVELYINGTYHGLYANTETINNSFCADRFASSSNTFISCSPVNKPTPINKSSLRYLAEKDSTAYYNAYELKSDFGWNDLMNLCDTISNHKSFAQSIIDMDRIIWMLAFNNAIVNLDSYSGVFAQNYYLYKDATGRYNPIIWDMNMSFGGFPFLGSGNSSMSSLSVAEMKNMPLFLHPSDNNWPLHKIITEDSSLRKIYLSHLRCIVNDWFYEGKIINKAMQYRDLIKDYVLIDENKFFSNDDFTNSLSEDISVGAYNVPGIQNLIKGRLDFFNSTPEFKYNPPIISDVYVSNNNPEIGSKLNVQARVENVDPDRVHFKYRKSKIGNFEPLQMNDAGLSGDEVANDGIYGLQITIDSDELHYYIFAENNLAVTFMPQQAEFSYFTIRSDNNTINLDDIVINEFMAKNTSGMVNEYGKYEDWIELHNTSTKDLNLSGSYLTDDETKLSKYKFPDGTVIRSGEYLVLWADESESTDKFLHANFKLSASGEYIILSNSNGLIIDSIKYPEQYDNKSMGRCSDFTKELYYFEKPTFAYENSCNSIILNSYEMSIYPNPTDDLLLIHFKPSTGRDNPIVITKEDVIIYDLLGMQIGNFTFNFHKDDRKVEIGISNLAIGVYFVKIGNHIMKFIKT